MSDELLKEAQSGLRLASVYLREVGGKLAAGFSPALMKGEKEFQLQNKISTREHVTFEPGGTQEENKSAPKFIEYHVMVEARVVDGDLTEDEINSGDITNEKVIAEIKATFAVLYHIVNEVSEEAIREFGIKNAPYHVWPYWRELLQSTGNRLDIAGIVLPMFIYNAQVATNSKLSSK